MNILLVGGCTKKQAMRSHREKGEAKRRSKRRRNPARRRNNCSGTVNCSRDKKYPRINPRRSPSLRLEYPFAYGLLRIEKFPRIAVRSLNIQMEAPLAAAIRGILPVYETLYSLKQVLWDARCFSCETFKTAVFPTCRVSPRSDPVIRVTQIDVNNKYVEIRRVLADYFQEQHENGHVLLR